MPSAAVDDVNDVVFTGTVIGGELQTATAVRGREVLRSCELTANQITMECVQAEPGARSVFSPPDKAKVWVTEADGSCAYHSIRGSLVKCKGHAQAPHDVHAIKDSLKEELLLHVLESSTPDTSATLTDDQLQKGRMLGLCEVRRSFTGAVLTGEPMNRSTKTCGWFQETVNDVIDNQWLDVSWLAFVAKIYRVNIVVWEPTGSGKKVQLYSAGNVKGLFLFDKKNKIDEAGDQWVHLLYRTSHDPWLARAGVGDPIGSGLPARHNHFDWLHVGDAAQEAFEGTISGPQQRPNQDPMETKPSSNDADDFGPTDQQKRAGSKARARHGFRTTTNGKGEREIRSTTQRLKSDGRPVVRKERKPSMYRKRKNAGPGSKAGAKGTKEKEGARKRGRKEASPEQLSYDSDGSIGGGETDWTNPESKGAYQTLTKDKRKLARELKRIVEPAYRRAFLLSNKRKTKGDQLLAIKEEADNRAKRAKMGGAPSGGSNGNKKGSGVMKRKREPQVEEDEEQIDEKDLQWSERGIPGYERTDAYDRRHQKSSESAVSLSKSAREKMPSLEAFMTTIDSYDGSFPLEQVVLTSFDMNFPEEAVNLFAEKTNAYVAHCTTAPPPGEDEHRRPHQVQKTRTLGHVTLENDHFEPKHIHGMIGIMITMGLTRKRRMRKHWSLSDHDNYPLVRQCMSRDFFELLYCRFLHCSDANAPPQLLDGKENPDYDSKWHIRLLEDILNKAWAENVDINQWLSYDEQMVKTVSRYSSYLMRYMPLKPITHGIKMYALCDVNGYCLISSVDGGFKGDPKLRRWFDCPLGRTTRHVLWVLLGACEVLKEKLVDSGVFIAMDNYFTSPTLFECLASHNIFAVGTCRSDRTSGAMQYLKSLGRTLSSRGDMNFCRSGELAFVHWRDSKDVLFCSTIHIAQPSQEDEAAGVGGINHFEPINLKMRVSGRKKKEEVAKQPIMRADNVKNMGGVDTADQQNGAHAHDHRSYTNYWRRVFEAKIQQALTNSFLIFKKWVSMLEKEAKEVDEQAASLERLEELDKARKELEKLAKVERGDWDEVMATELMSKCKVGSIGNGGNALKRKTVKCTRVWGSVKLGRLRKCMNPECTRRSKHGCTCSEYCTQGDKKGVLMCQQCFLDTNNHQAAATAMWEGYDGQRARKPMQWLT